jgi:hypothetical protein
LNIMPSLPNVSMALVIAGMFRQFGALGGHQFVEFLFRHQLIHAARGTLQLGFRNLAALGRKGGPGGFLLGFGFGWHDILQCFEKVNANRTRYWDGGSFFR